MADDVAEEAFQTSYTAANSEASSLALDATQLSPWYSSRLLLIRLEKLMLAAMQALKAFSSFVLHSINDLKLQNHEIRESMYEVNAHSLNLAGNSASILRDLQNLRNNLAVLSEHREVSASQVARSMGSLKAAISKLNSNVDDVFTTTRAKQSKLGIKLEKSRSDIIEAFEKFYACLLKDLPTVLTETVLESTSDVIRERVGAQIKMTRQMLEAHADRIERLCNGFLVAQEQAIKKADENAQRLTNTDQQLASLNQQVSKLPAQLAGQQIPISASSRNTMLCPYVDYPQQGTSAGGFPPWAQPSSWGGTTTSVYHGCLCAAHRCITSCNTVASHHAAHDERICSVTCIVICAGGFYVYIRPLSNR